MALAALFGALAPSARAQLAPPAKEIPLYPGVAPGSENWNWTERSAGAPGNPTIQNVVHPELMYYPADKAKAVGTAMIVAPGGGFQNLMMSYEGVDIAKRFNDMGVDAFVLKYRLKFTDPNARRRAGASTQPSAAADASAAGPQAGQDIRAIGGQDGQQAVRILRQSAADYGYRPDRIGFIGFSAGGAVMIRAVRGNPDGRPNFAAGVYAADLKGDAPPAGAFPGRRRGRSVRRIPGIARYFLGLAQGKHPRGTAHLPDRRPRLSQKRRRRRQLHGPRRGVDESQRLSEQMNAGLTSGKSYQRLRCTNRSSGRRDFFKSASAG
jgi:dienelactone hydrolase